MKLNPFLAFLKTHLYLVSGRLHFPQKRVGEMLTMEDGQTFVIFRQVVLKPGRDQKVEPGAVFRVRFHVANMSAKQNKLFSLLPLPLFIGLPGFRSKLWLLNEANGDFQGIYEWETLQDAEHYAHSFAMKFMTKRSVPGTVSYQIIPAACRATHDRLSPQSAPTMNS